MSEVVQAWAWVCLSVGSMWAGVMLLGLIAVDRRFLQARVLMGAFAFLGLVLASVGLIGMF